ncbi:MAG: hypothetical protein LQ342_006326 [Letrouitia transgressa]|nr:MAG: hypothetical protein LQ342_006326 [Letrouitia transgressa]
MAMNDRPEPSNQSRLFDNCPASSDNCSPFVSQNYQSSNCTGCSGSSINAIVYIQGSQNIVSCPESLSGNVSSNESDPFLGTHGDFPHRTEDSEPLTGQDLEDFKAFNEMALKGADWLIKRARERKAAQDLKAFDELVQKRVKLLTERARAGEAAAAKQ